MKNIDMSTIRVAVTVALLMATLSADAQYADLYYHRVGDTIEWKPNNGYFSWWEFEQFYNYGYRTYVRPFLPYNNDIVGARNSTDSAILLQKFYTPVPLKIIGVASYSVQGWVSSGVVHMDTTEIPEYLLIYDADSTTFIQKSKTRWTPYDPYRIVHIKEHPVQVGCGDSCCCPELEADKYFPIREYYFDSAFYVTDSFYVGGTQNDNYYAIHVRGDNSRTHIVSAVTDGIHNSCPSELMTTWGYRCFPVDITFKGHGISAPYSLFGNEAWWWANTNNQQILYPMIVYPIIEVDTTVPPAGYCIPVGNVEATAGITTATVTWDYFPNYTSVFLRYGLANTPLSLWTEVNVTDQTIFTLTDLEPSCRYGVRLQAECEKGNPMEWSETVYFLLEHDTTTSIATPTPLSEQTFLQPNPAHDEVTVTSSFNMSRLELHDASGVMVYSELVSGHETVLNIGFLRSGTYIVTIHTHNGITHKQLVVTR